jgi:peptidoglycan/xylan/chitin deacetylase (PgdA/CDA1 family)
MAASGMSTKDRHGSSVTVLAYHRIATPASQPELAPTLIDAYPADFEAQMRYLAARYNVVSSWDLVRALREGYSLPRRAVIITFDDGYRCFKETAVPILRRLGLPVTLFVPTYYPSNPGALFWWDALHRALTLTNHTSLEVRNAVSGVRNVSLGTQAQRDAAFEQLVPMIERLEEADAKRLFDCILEQCGVEPNSEPHMLDWEEITELAAEGVAVGPHTRNHNILAQLTPERARDEVAWSWSDLQARIPNPLPIFCYPNGKPHAINRSAVNSVRQSGLVGAYTMMAGLNRVGRTNPYLLYRVGAVAGESLRRFSLKITLAGRVYRQLKALARRRPEAFTL